MLKGTLLGKFTAKETKTVDGEVITTKKRKFRYGVSGPEEEVQAYLDACAEAGYDMVDENTGKAVYISRFNRGSKVEFVQLDEGGILIDNSEAENEDDFLETVEDPTMKVEIARQLANERFEKFKADQAAARKSKRPSADSTEEVEDTVEETVSEDTDLQS